MASNAHSICPSRFFVRRRMFAILFLRSALGISAAYRKQFSYFHSLLHWMNANCSRSSINSIFQLQFQWAVCYTFYLAFTLPTRSQLQTICFTSDARRQCEQQTPWLNQKLSIEFSRFRSCRKCSFVENTMNASCLISYMEYSRPAAKVSTYSNATVIENEENMFDFFYFL